MYKTHKNTRVTFYEFTFFKLNIFLNTGFKYLTLDVYLIFYCIEMEISNFNQENQIVQKARALQMNLEYEILESLNTF